MSYTAEQRAFANARLVENLRFKYKKLSNYSDEQIVQAYDDWFFTDGNEHGADEDGFLEFLQGYEE